MPKERISFDHAFNGTLELNDVEKSVQLGTEGVKPYEMAMAGLVSCFYSTFMDMAVKKKLEWEEANIEIEWVKDLESTPQFLKEAHIQIALKADPEKEKKFHKSFELAAKYCSLYQTFSKVATLSWDLKMV